MAFAQVFPPESDTKGSDQSHDLRFEGIRQYREVSETVLKSVTIGKTEKDETNTNRCHLLFYVPEDSYSKNISILLENKEGLKYYMIPRRKDWDGGNNDFSWDSSFSLQNNVHLKNLYALATKRESGIATTVFPILLYYSDKGNIEYMVCCID
jgi:hypothetical protein